MRWHMEARFVVCISMVGTPVAVPLLACSYRSGLFFLIDVLPPLCCGDQRVCLHLMDEGGDTCVPSLKVQMSEHMVA